MTHDYCQELDSLLQINKKVKIMYEKVILCFEKFEFQLFKFQAIDVTIFSTVSYYGESFT